MGTPAAPGNPLATPLTPLAEGITPRELEIIHWVAEGKYDKEIAILLGIAIQTVKNHKAKIFIKLNCHNTAHMVRIACSKGLVRL